MKNSVRDKVRCQTISFDLVMAAFLFYSFKLIPGNSPPQIVSLPILGGTPSLSPYFAKNGQISLF